LLMQRLLSGTGLMSCAATPHARQRGQAGLQAFYPFAGLAMYLLATASGQATY